MPQQPSQSDFILYAGTLGRWVGKDNPFKIMADDILRTLNVVSSIQTKKKLAKQKIDILNARVAKLEAAMAEGSRPTSGQRLNKLR